MIEMDIFIQRYIRYLFIWKHIIFNNLNTRFFYKFKTIKIHSNNGYVYIRIAHFKYGVLSRSNFVQKDIKYFIL